MIKKLITASIMGTALISTSVMAAPRTCADKQRAIETEISYAKAHNNTYRLQGLNRALADVKAYCTDEGLQAKRQEKVTEKEHDVAKAERELKAAQAKNDSKKIAKKQKKLQEALSDLAEAKASL
ncbi:DUF1090 domain-containing protein [Neisseria sp. Ec49-e6-T10]|uniref:DUF1090 domain-containing protein n=1 Tax=Neisseria sp. Ec49-e6-T10 TaxID=3140744 RepID=UPI003EC0DF15